MRLDLGRGGPQGPQSYIVMDNVVMQVDLSLAGKEYILLIDVLDIVLDFRTYPFFLFFGSEDVIV